MIPETRRPIEDSQDARDEAFLRHHSSRSGGAVTSVDRARSELVRLLDLAREGMKAVDPTSRAYNSGRVSALEEALKLVEGPLLDEYSERIRAAAQEGQEG